MLSVLEISWALFSVLCPSPPLLGGALFNPPVELKRHYPTFMEVFIVCLPEKKKTKQILSFFICFRHSGSVGFGLYDALTGLHPESDSCFCNHHVRHLYGRTGRAEAHVEKQTYIYPDSFHPVDNDMLINLLYLITFVFCRIGISSIRCHVLLLSLCQHGVRHFDRSRCSFVLVGLHGRKSSSSGIDTNTSKSICLSCNVLFYFCLLTNTDNLIGKQEDCRKSHC